MESVRPIFMQLSVAEQQSALEAIIFASDQPITLNSLYNILVNSAADKSGNGANLDETRIDYEDLKGQMEADKKNKNECFKLFTDLIEKINQDLIQTNRPYFITKIAGGYQFVTRTEYGYVVNMLIKSKNKRRLSQASLETLAIIAYKQPISKPEIEQIRGVNSNEIVNSLQEKNLVEMVGRKDVLGKPIIYGTTIDFLKTFGLNSIDELPKLRELDDFSGLISEDSPVIEVGISS